MPNKKAERMREMRVNLALSSGLFALLGCGDGATVFCVRSATPGACEAIERLEPAPTAAEPAYLLGTRVWDDTSTTSYFHVVPSLEEGTPVDSRLALEVPGAAKLYSAFDLGWFAIGSGESPSITRYSLDPAGALVQGESISLLDYGVADLWDTLYFVSATKAYYPDRDGGQLIVWNPTEMRVLGSIPLPETLREGYLPLYGYAPIWRGGELLISVGWFDWDVTDSVLPETGLIVLDTVTDNVLRFDVDTRCGGVTSPLSGATGDTYLVSSALAGAAHRLGRLPTAPCALRILAGSDEIDPDYLMALSSISPGTLVGEPVPAQGGGVFLRAFDESLATGEAPAATWELTSQAAWRWWRWDPQANTSELMTELPPSTADVSWFQADGRVWGTQTTPDYSETTLIDLSHASGPRRGLTAPGFLHGVTRLR